MARTDTDLLDWLENTQVAAHIWLDTSGDGPRWSVRSGDARWCDSLRAAIDAAMDAEESTDG